MMSTSQTITTLPPRTLRWKKTIGIIAIVLGALRFISSISAFSQLSKTEKIIDDYNSLSSADWQLVRDLQSYVNFARVILPFELVVLAAIFTLGIVLLCVDKGLTDEMPRDKSRQVCVALTLISIFYVVMEGVTYLNMPSSVNSELSPVTIIFSLGFAILLPIWCIVGLNLPPKKHVTGIIVTGDDLTSPERTTILNEINHPTNVAITQPEPLSPLDTEIEQLKKEIEKRKLEKEMEQINAEKQAEIEQLKKELADLE